MISEGDLAEHMERQRALVTTKAYYVGHERYSFQGAVPAEVIGVRVLDVKGTARACFHLLYPDGRTDYASIDDKCYRLVSMERGEVA